MILYVFSSAGGISSLFHFFLSPFPPINIRACNPSVSVFLPSVFFSSMGASMVGVSKYFFEGLVSGVFPPITYGFLLLGSSVRRPVLSSFIRNPSCIACFFPAPLFFVCTAGLSCFIIISLIEGRFPPFFSLFLSLPDYSLYIYRPFFT
ncbi:hypothetical protein B9Z19DRAFT_790539 [Tuber borchii]|uniref:Uncharacterized protein n=1 Tax=Tuber borchii TaxID=42251 RepID=A0A2T6ZWE9_TUBBO|nr:hypothetical protein B9Z19DRAFT_790539 [Tuber borchii]